MAEIPVDLGVAAGEYMDSATLTEWLKQPGDQVKAGEVIAVVETAKAVSDVEAPIAGVLARIAFAVGQEVPVGATVAWIESSSAPVAAAPPASPAPTAAERSTVPASAPVAAPAVVEAEGGRVAATPLARNLARELGIDLARVGGTGPGGRITDKDVREAAAASGAVAPSAASSAPSGAASSGGQDDGYDVPAQTTYRRVTAEHMALSAAIPQFQLTSSIEMTALLAARDALPKESRPTVTAMLTKAVGQALRATPRVNSAWIDGGIRQYRAVNINVAVATDLGLAVPLIPAADRRPIAEIDRELAEKRDRAERQRLKPDDIGGGTFTLSNLGPGGVTQFNALVNPPQAAILAVGGTFPALVAGDPQPRIAPCCLVTLSCDHRVLDGADGAAFLRALKSLVEEPITWQEVAKED